MDDRLKQLGLDQYMMSKDSPLYSGGNTSVSTDVLYDNVVGAASFSTGRVNAPITVGGKTGHSFLRIDGPNNRFISNDGTTNRIIIGSV